MVEHIATAATWSHQLVHRHLVAVVRGRHLLWVVLVPAILRHVDHSLLLSQLVHELLVDHIAVSIARLIPAHTTQLVRLMSRGIRTDFEHGTSGRSRHHVLIVQLLRILCCLKARVLFNFVLVLLRAHTTTI